MRVRTRLGVWLIAAVAVAGGLEWFAVRATQRSVIDRVERDLRTVHALESHRIDVALDQKARLVRLLADRAPLAPLLSGDDSSATLDEVIDGVSADADAIDATMSSFALVDTDLNVLASTGPSDEARALADDLGLRYRDDTLSQIRFGLAFVGADGGTQMTILAPAVDELGEAVGGLLVTCDLAPIVDFVQEYESFGDTAEAHVAQRNADGDAQFITSLRFAPDAAFNMVIPASADKPIIDALDSPGLTVVHSTDYRDVESIMAYQTIARTGWGLVVKIDTNDALGPVNDLRRNLILAGLFVVVALAAGWALLVRPIGRRLALTAEAAQRIAEGDLSIQLGDTRRDEIGEVARSIDRLAHDLDEDIAARNEAERRLRHEIDHDELTGIKNRMFAATAIGELLTAGHAVSVLFTDLDGFKQINDAHGHHVGDEILRVVGRRLEGAVSMPCFAARWGGDEFVVVLPDVGDASVSEYVERIEALFDSPVDTSVGPLPVGTSVGAATADGSRSPSAPDDAADQPAPGDDLGEVATVDSLISEADRAMFVKKHRRVRAGRAAARASELVQSALDTGRVELHYQPVFSVEVPASVTGAECLVRIRGADGRLLIPAEFLPQIRSSELSHRLDQFVAAAAIRQVGRWRRAGTVDDRFCLAINLGGSALESGSTSSWIRDLLDENGVDGSGVMVEITEDDARIHPELVPALRSLGVRIALDDVGLSASNIDRLVDLDATDAKIDRRWLHSAGDANDRATAPFRHLVTLCRDLGKAVTIEGVETDAQLDACRSVGADAVQGHLLGPPVDPDEFRSRFAGAERSASLS